MIKPTVGRVVWFYRYVAGQGHKGPMAAIVCDVHSDSMVNLMVIAQDGVPRGETSVRLEQDVRDPAAAPQFSYCTWMPYQKAVASGRMEGVLHA